MRLSWSLIAQAAISLRSSLVVVVLFGHALAYFCLGSVWFFGRSVLGEHYFSAYRLVLLSTSLPVFYVIAGRFRSLKLRWWQVAAVGISAGYLSGLVAYCVTYFHGLFNFISIADALLVPLAAPLVLGAWLYGLVLVFIIVFIENGRFLRFFAVVWLAFAVEVVRRALD